MDNLRFDLQAFSQPSDRKEVTQNSRHRSWPVILDAREECCRSGFDVTDAARSQNKWNFSDLAEAGGLSLQFQESPRRGNITAWTKLVEQNKVAGRVAEDAVKL